MKILYAEDEKQLSMAVAEILKMSGYEVDAVYDGAEALEHLKTQSYQAAVLDIMMPKMDGIEVLSKLREMQDYTPVMLLTAKTQVEDRIGGLSVGADDYLGKPFDMREFLARLAAMVRRNGQYSEAVLTSGNFSLNCRTYELTSEITTLHLSSNEAGLLAFLMKKEGSKFTASELRDQAFPDAKDDKTVELYLSYLKNKLMQLQADKGIRSDNGTYTLGETE